MVFQMHFIPTFDVMFMCFLGIYFVNYVLQKETP